MLKFGAKNKTKESDHFSAKLNTFLHIIKNYSILSEDYLDSLTQFGRVFDAQYASVYLFEKKTNMFLLKKWFGHEPSRYSISGDYEFMNMIKRRAMPVHRSEFVAKTANEMRQPALFYYQQTLSDIVCPILNGEHWMGLVNVHVNEGEKSELTFLHDSLLEIYVDAMRSWLYCQSLQKDKQKLAEMSDVKNQLLANVTHELQTPLNGILGVTEALLAGTDDINEATKEHIKLIQKSGKELDQTVGNLLKLVQIESKKNALQREKLQILNLIKEVAFLYGEACEKKNVKIIIPKSEDGLFVFGHPDQIRTVFMNLIGNAVKFTETGEIRIEVKKSGEMLHVSVSDTGIGISDEKLSLIFEEFYQADGSHTRLYGGTGLGLAIAKKIITIHSGRIWAESQQGHGSSFTFTLPMYPV